MGWNNFVFAGSASAQADDAETGTISELGTGVATLTLPEAIRIVDVVLDKSAASPHQYRFYVNGKAQGSNFFAAQINPGTQGRLNWANQNIIIPAGATVQVRGSQKSGAIEASTLLLQYVPA